jgi:hypothetical protein
MHLRSRRQLLEYEFHCPPNSFPVKFLLNTWVLSLPDCMITAASLAVYIVTWRLKAVICPSAGRGVTEHIPMATPKAPLLDGEMLEHVSTATDMAEEAMHCIQSRVSCVPVHTAANLQSTVTVNNAITLCWRRWSPYSYSRSNPRERIDQKKTEYNRTQKTKMEVRSEVFSLCGITMVHSYEVL